LQPFVEGEIVGQSAKQAHGSVSVTVNQTGQHKRAVRIDGLRAFESALDFSARPHRNDRIPPDSHAPILINRPRRIHRHHHPAADNQIDILLLLRDGDGDQHDHGCDQDERASSRFCSVHDCISP